MKKEITVNTSKKEILIDITREIEKVLSLWEMENGVILLFVPHTTAAVTINENADPDVQKDIINGLKRVVPEIDFDHFEGNSSAHIKSSMFGVSLMLGVTNGRIDLGTWQGVYFCEFDGPRARKVVIKRCFG